jgi:hypothetical protein
MVFKVRFSAKDTQANLNRFLLSCPDFLLRLSKTERPSRSRGFESRRLCQLSPLNLGTRPQRRSLSLSVDHFPPIAAAAEQRVEGRPLPFFQMSSVFKSFRDRIARAIAPLNGSPCGFVPLADFRLGAGIAGADSILAAARLYRRLPEHRRLCSPGTPSHSLLAQVDRPQVTSQQPGSSRPS